MDIGRDEKATFAEKLHELPLFLRGNVKLEVWPEGGVWVGAGDADTLHQHFTASVKIALTGSFRIRTPGTDFTRTVAATTAPLVEQQLDARGAILANVFIDPESDAFDRLSGVFARSPSGFSILRDDVAAALSRELREIVASRQPLVRGWDAVVERLADGAPRRRKIDARIRRVATILKREFAAPPRLSVLARAVGLSEGRLTHLFTQEMGLPLRQYVLWLRVRDVVYSLGVGRSLTQAAHDAGFSDSPHLSRTFRAMFGVPPSVLIRSRGQIDLTFDVETALRRPGPHAEMDAARIARLVASRTPEPVPLSA